MMIPKFEIYLRIVEKERENIYYMVIWQTTPSGRQRWAGMQSALNELEIRGKVLMALHSLQAAVRVRERTSTRLRKLQLPQAAGGKTGHMLAKSVTFVSSKGTASEAYAIARNPVFNRKL